MEKDDGFNINPAEILRPIGYAARSPTGLRHGSGNGGLVGQYILLSLRGLQQQTEAIPVDCVNVVKMEKDDGFNINPAEILRPIGYAARSPTGLRYCSGNGGLIGQYILLSLRGLQQQTEAIPVHCVNVVKKG